LSTSPAISARAAFAFQRQRARIKHFHLRRMAALALIANASERTAATGAKRMTSSLAVAGRNRRVWGEASNITATLHQPHGPSNEKAVGAVALRRKTAAASLAGGQADRVGAPLRVAGKGGNLARALLIQQRTGNKMIRPPGFTNVVARSSSRA
jgi:hypothetical protein